MSNRPLKLLITIAVTGLVMMVVVGCAQGAGKAPSGSTDPTTSSSRSGERSMTPEQTASFYRIPVPKSEFRGGGLVECADKRTKATIYDYAQGIGNKASPLQQTRRQFSKRIEEGDTVEMAEQVVPNEGWYGEALRTVRVVRDGRVVALVFFREGY